MAPTAEAGSPVNERPCVALGATPLYLKCAGFDSRHENRLH
jgi:hypothetical protein